MRIVAFLIMNLLLGAFLFFLFRTVPSPVGLVPPYHLYPTVAMSSNEPDSSIPLRPQADPLPRKIGELGSPQDAAVTSVSSELSGASAVDDDMILRPHPAESSSHLPIPEPSISTASLPGSLSTPSTRSPKPKVPTIVKFLRNRSANSPMPMIYGIRLSTLLRLFFLVFAFTGIVVAWILTVVLVKGSKGPPASDGQTSHNGAIPSSMNASIIFIHIGFGVTTLLLGILLERATFIARAERYNFVHRSDSNSGSGVGPPGITFVPWNRPSLPTYANALGYRGTGDVEDNYIAPLPPPEYGNTRSSTLLMSALYPQYPQERPTSYTSRISAGSGGRVGHSDDDDGGAAEGDSVADYARRARMLEEALATLECGSLINEPPAAVLRT
jgi:hypothetical protein